MKARMRMLLIGSFILPLMIVWIVTGARVYHLYKSNVDNSINTELGQVKENMDVLMNSMKYMSQQIVNDQNIAAKLKLILRSGTAVQQVNALAFIKEQLDVYEISNPDVSNITLFTRVDDTFQRVIPSSLVRKALPGEDKRLSTQYKIVYYGPHETRSVIGRYLVLSLLYKIEIADAPEVYVYIESGYKRVKVYSEATLAQLGAVYAVVSDTGAVVYSSDESIVPAGAQAPAHMGGSFLEYAIEAKQGWSLRAYVPVKTYFQYMSEHNLAFLLLLCATVAIAVAVAAVLWRSINRPLRAFKENLDNIMTDDIEASIQKIHVEEFDRNFAYFDNMKQRIASLVLSAQRSEQEKAELSIKQMLTKINPHFIHNTLYTLKWYADQHGYADVEAFVSSLSRLLMYNMEKDRVTTLRSELDAVRDYIALQRYKYDIEYEEELSLPEPMLDTDMPRFVLQPLVENAILHGIEGHGRIRMLVSLREDGRIAILVANDGQAIDPERIEQILHSSRDLSTNGIGVQYVAQMLAIKFPGAFELNVRTDGHESGVEIVVPFNKGAYYAEDVDR